MISIRDSIKPVEPSRRIRVIGIATMFAMVWATAQFVGVDRFSTFYGNVLILLACLFTPWTAINLIDYFFVRKGLYAIKEIFRADGIYGRWGWRGQLAHGVSLLAMVPFLVTVPFTGFMGTALGGVDYSILSGLPIAGVLYIILCRSLDLETERRIVAREGLLTGVH